MNKCYIITEALRKRRGQEYYPERCTIGVALTLEGAEKYVLNHCNRTIERIKNNPDMDIYYKIDKVEYYYGVIYLLKQELRNRSEEDFIIGHAVHMYGISIECVKLI